MSYKVTAKPVEHFRITLADGTDLGTFYVSDEWRDFLELRQPNSLDTMIVANQRNRFFPFLMRDSEFDLHVIRASPNLAHKIEQAEKAKRFGPNNSAAGHGYHDFVNGRCACGQSTTDDPARCPIFGPPEARTV